MFKETEKKYLGKTDLSVCCNLISAGLTVSNFIRNFLSSRSTKADNCNLDKLKFSILIVITGLLACRINLLANEGGIVD